MISIDKIEIKNFKQYRKVELTFDEKKGAYFFTGKNGAGKSNFMNAICWCLYGTTPFRSGSDKTTVSESIINRDAEKDGEEEAEVRITATIADRTFLICRYTNPNMLSNTIARRQNDSFVAEVVDGGLVPQNNPELTIEQLLPSDLSNLFIFDGEVIKTIFDGDYSENLKNRVYKVSNIDLLRRAKDNINGVIKEYKKQRKTTQVDVMYKTRMEKKKDEYEKEEKELEDSLKELEGTKRDYESKRDSLYKALGKYNDADVLVKESKEIEKEIKELIKNKDKKQKQILQKIQKIVPFAIMGENVKIYLDAINGAIENGKLPPSILPEELEHICDTDMCICKRALDEEARKAIVALLEESRRTNELSFLSGHAFGCSGIINTAKAELDELNAMEEELYDFGRNLDEKNKRLEVLKGQIKNTGAYAQITGKNPNLEMDAINKALSKIYGDITLKSHKLETCKTEIEGITNELDGLVDNSKENRLIQAKIARLENINNVIESIENKILNDTRQKIEDGATETYKHLHWKTEIEKVDLSEDYVLSILQTNGDRVALNELASGEKKMLGISIINALSKKIKNFDFPFFIDSPTEELDQSVIPILLENLQILSQEKQLFVMTLNKPEVTAFLASVPDEREFNLVHREGSIETTDIERRKK